jgi:hypothetical protein
MSPSGLSHIIAALSLAGPAVEPMPRSVRVDPDVLMHQETVVCVPRMQTKLVLPEPFASQHVACGDCVVVGSVSETDENKKPDSGAQTGEQEPQKLESSNWVIEVDVSIATIYLRVLHAPKEAILYPVFQTIVHVTLQSGYQVAFLAKLFDPARHTHADSVVSLTYPAGHTAVLQRRVEKEKDRLRQQGRDEVWRKFDNLVLDEVKCKDVRWNTPHRSTDDTAVRLRQLCRSRSTNRSLFVVFDVQNLRDSPLKLSGASLEPVDGSVKIEDERYGYRRRKPASGDLGEGLKFRDVVRGYALVVLDGDSEDVPETWRLTVKAGSGGRESVMIDDLVF